jgi:gliding motility-associated-like protein
VPVANAVLGASPLSIVIPGGAASGTYQFTITVKNGNNCSSTSQNFNLTINPLPAAITGTTSVCVGSTTTLSDATAGGTWSSASPAVATITAGGVVTGVTAGTSVISYTLPTGCAVTATVTVNPLPAAITGTTSVCVGSTTTLSNATAGGTWSSATPAVATITAGGVVTGVTAGTSVISYTLPTGCAVTATVTVNALPTITLGVIASVCQGSTTFSLPYTATTGVPTTYSIAAGVPAMAGFVPVVNAVLGASPLSIAIPGGAASGTYQFTISVKNGNNCSSTSQNFNLTLDPLPAAITGTTSVCVGSTTTLSDATAGGTWSSATPAVATITAGGVVTGVTTGTSVISYTLPTGCAVTATVTVNALPTISLGVIASVCQGSTTFSLPYTATTGVPTTYSIVAGVPAMAGFVPIANAVLGASPLSISIPGGAASGTYQFTITVKNGNNCSSTSQNFNLTINPLPAAITGTTSVCVGSTTTLSDATAGGTWSSATPAVATITAGGVVTGVTAGTSVISYTLPTGCAVTATVTVNPLPAAITGVTSVCVGSTTTLSNATAGGAWSSATPAVATITAGGVVTGVTAGTSVISYTLPTGCAVTATVTVNALPTITLGVIASVCQGSTTFSLPYTATTGVPTTYSIVAGVPAMAGFVPVVNAVLGASPLSIAIPGGAASGTYQFTITVKNGNNCSSTSQNFNLTLDPLPAAITGTTSVCVSATTTLSNATAGGTWSSGTPAVATITAGGVVTGVTAGTSVISYTLPSGCAVTATVTVNALPTITLGVVSSVCQGATTFSLPYTATTGVPTSYSIVTGAPAMAGFVPVANALLGASPLSIAIPGGAAIGTYQFTITVKNGNNCSSTSQNFNLTINPLPAAITGTTSVCVSSTTTLSNATAGGTWSSATPAVATITAGGVVTGVTAGTSIISYTLPTGCAETVTVTVNPLPAAITGNLNVCLGSTTSLSNATAGGIWSSATPAVATITAGGIVSGVTLGTSVISYTLPSGCLVTATVTVNPLPVAIAGITTVCAGSTTTLSNATAGGTWSSATPAVATITAGGVVTGVAAGTSVISYTLPTGCAVTATVTVEPLPAAITGNTSVCIGSTTTLSNATAGGIWSSATPAVATITAGGVVSGITAGTSVITYTIPTGCFVTTTITVVDLPTITLGIIGSVCEGSASFGLPYTATTGVPTSYSITAGVPALAGFTPVSDAAFGASPLIISLPVAAVAGTYQFTITVKNGNNCISVSQNFNLTINPLPAAITGTTNVCEGSTTILSNATAGGSWSSASPATATVNAGGVVTGVVAGTAVISYTLPTGCAITQTVTVDPLPTAILGTASVCLGSTTNLSNATAGGTWSSATPAIATITAGGVVTGVSAGTSVISYTIPTGCSVTQTITVNALPTISLAAVSPVCEGSSNFSLPYTATTGAPSSYSIIADIPAIPGFIPVLDSPLGISPLSVSIPAATPAGTYQFIITVKDGNSCTSANEVFSLTINPLPPAITGTLTVCIGSTTALSNAVAGGVWSSASPAIATVDAAGVVSGISTGTSDISYTLPTGCFITTTVSVFPSSDITFTVSDPTACYFENTNVNVSGSEIGVSYILRDNGNLTVAGPLAGTGAGLTFTLNSASMAVGAFNYNVLATSLAGCSIMLPDLAIVTRRAEITNTIIKSDISCNGLLDGKINVTAANGTAPYVVSIDSGLTYPETTGVDIIVPSGNYNVFVKDNDNCLSALQTVVIVEPAVLTSSTAKTDITCNSLGNGTVTITPSGGTSPYTYAKGALPYQGSNVFTNLIKSTFTFTTKDASGCTTSNTVTINEPAVLLIQSEFRIDNNLCYGDSLGEVWIEKVLGGVSPFEYSIDGGLNYYAQNNFQKLPAGSYQTVVRDSHGCFVNGSLNNIHQPAIIYITGYSQVDASSCFDSNNGQIIIGASGGAGDLSYSLDGLLNNATGVFDAVEGGSHVLTMTDTSLCSLDTTVVLAQPSEIVFSSLIINDVTGCAGNSNGTLDAVASGGAGSYTYSFDGGAYVASVSYSGLLAGSYALSAMDANSCVKDTSITILEPAPVSILSQTSQNITCASDNNGSITITGGGGTAPYTYVLNPGAISTNNTGFFDLLPPDTYTVDVNDDNGCGSVSTLPIIISEPLALTRDSVNTKDISCAGSSDAEIHIFVSGGTSPFNYSNDDGANFGLSKDFTALTPGTYYLSMTDAGGCSLNLDTVIFADPLALSLVSENKVDIVSCFNDPVGEVDYVVSGGTGSIEYSLDLSVWQPSGHFTGLNSGDYTITARDQNLCTLSSSVLSVTAPDTISADISTTPDLNEFNKGTITIANATGGTGTLTFSITGPAGAFSATTDYSGLDAGNYPVVIKDDNNCTFEQTAVVLSIATLDVTVSLTNSTCNGSNDASITMVSSNGTPVIEYSIDDSTSWSETGTFTDLLPGTYYVFVRDGQDRYFQDTVLLTEPITINIFGNITPSSCSSFSGDGAIDVSVNGGVDPYEFQWLSGEISEDLANINAGEYSVTVTDSKSCSNEKSFVITAITSVIADAGQDTSICFGDDLELNGQGGSTMSWLPIEGLSNPNISNPVASVTSDMNYILTVTGFNDCFDTDTIAISVRPVEGLFAGNDTLIIKDQEVTLLATGGVFTSYSWIPAAGLATPNQASTLANPQATTNFIVLAQTEFGCTESDTVLVKIAGNIIIYDAFSPNNGDDINNYFEIEYAELYPEMIVEVFTRWGEKLFSSSGYSDEQRWDGTYKGKDVPIGTYYYVVVPYKGADAITGPLTIVR